MADPRLMQQSPLAFARSRDDRERFQNNNIGLTRMDGFRASRERATFDAASNTLNRMQERRALEQRAEREESPLIPPEELNERFRDDMQRPFEAPLPLEVAEFIAQRQRRVKELDAIIANTPDGFFSGAAAFGGSMTGFVTDPVEIMADIVIGPLTGFAGTVLRHGSRAARAGVLAGRAKKATEGLTPTAAAALRGTQKAGRALEKAGDALTKSGTFRASVARGLMVNVASEGLALGVSHQDMLDRSAAESLASVTLGTVGFAGLGALGRRLLGRMSARENKAILEVVENQMINDRKIDIEPVVQELNARGNAPVPGKGEYHFNHNRAEVASGSLFFPAKSLKFKPQDGLPVGEIRLGSRRGVTLSDDYSKANASAARPFEGQGGVIQVKAGKGLKLFDLDTAPLPGFSEKILAKLEEVAVASKARGASAFKRLQKQLDELEKSTSARELFEKVEDAIGDGWLPEEALDALEDIIEELGFDGLAYTDSGFGRIQNPVERLNARKSGKVAPGNASNVIKVFNHDKLKVLARDGANKKAVGGKRTKAEIQELKRSNSARENDTNFDPVHEKTRIETPSEFQKPDPPEAVRAREEQAFSDLQELEKSMAADLPPEAQAVVRNALEQYKRSKSFSEKADSAVKGAVSCLGGKRGR